MGGTVCREPFNNNSPKLVLVNNLTATRVMQTSILESADPHNNELQVLV